ncbi:IS66 family transposase [Chachezhania antarctica]|uniref:IS66 family transposase n=1 Tax=Chachezhania antarctica TaxID=2340860 RepID=UPI001968CB29|nr:transposase [Marivita sp.]
MSVNAPRERHFDPALVSAHLIKARSQGAASRGRTHDRTVRSLSSPKSRLDPQGASTHDGRDPFRPWLEAQLSRIPRSSKLADDIRYTLARWQGLTRFLEDGRLELDTNPVENQIRKIEPRRVCRRLISFSYAAMSSVSRAA